MKKTLALLLALVMVLGLFAACGNTDTGTTTEGKEDTTTQSTTEATTTEAPKELKTLTFLGRDYNTMGDYQTLDYWMQNYKYIYAAKQLEERGVKIEFETISDEQYDQAAGAKIQAGIDLPDVFKMAGSLTAKQLYDAGIVANIKDILDEYDTDDSVRQFWKKWAGGAITSLMDGEGNIYQTPYIFQRRYVHDGPEYNPIYDNAQVISVRRDWVEAIGEEWNEVMTAEELVDLLIKIREKDGNGNGAADEVLGERVDNFTTGLERAYGMVRGLWGNYHGEEVICNLYHEKFPEYIAQLQRLYNAGCIDLTVPNGDLTTAVIYANRGMTLNGSATAYWIEGNIAGYENTADFQAVFLDEDKDLSTGYYVNRNGNHTVWAGPAVSADADMEAVAIWLDWFYTEEVRELCCYGIEGIDFFERYEDGEPIAHSFSFESDEEKYAYYEEKFKELGIEDYGDVRAYLSMSSHAVANAWPHIECFTMTYEQAIAGYDYPDQPGFKGATDTLKTDGKYMQYSKWNSGMEFAAFTDEELEAYNSVANTVITYVSELLLGLITGQKDIADLDTYIAEVEELGLTTIMEIMNARHQRYMDAEG